SRCRSQASGHPTPMWIDGIEFNWSTKKGPWEKSSLPGRCGGEIARCLACTQTATELSTTIRHRHLTPSCGGRAPTAERTASPARVSVESLLPRPELENSIDRSRLWQLPVKRA